MNPIKRLFLLAGVCLLGAACSAIPQVPHEKPTPAMTESGKTPPAQGSERTAPLPEASETGRASETTTPAEVAIKRPSRWQATRAPAELRISAVGDIMLGGSATAELAKRGYQHPFARIRDMLRDSHVVFGNLEGPLTDAGQPDREKRYVFRSPPDKVAPALAAAGFNVVALANNHTMDYGVEGLKQTLATLDVAGIQHVGAGMNLLEARAPALMTVGDYTVAFLAYSLTFPERFWARRGRAGTAFGHESHVRTDAAEARQRADIVIVSFHWGREVTATLRDYQPRLARAAIDAGASVVLGHHPHILQAIERYKHGVIFYSLGNFAFGSYSRRATRSVIAQLKFQDSQLVEIRLIPLNVNNLEVVFQPQPLYAHEADAVIDRLRQLSEPLGTKIENRNGIGTVVLSGKSGQPLLSKKNN